MKLLILSALSMISISSWAQVLLYNDGATVTVQAGATLYVEGSITNTSTVGSTIVNNGTIELKGDLLNMVGATITSNTGSILKFSGSGLSKITSNTATFYDVVMAKTTTFNLYLQDALTINHNLSFSGPLSTGNKIKLFGNNLIFGNAATAVAGASYTSPSASCYIVTNGAGSVRKVMTGAGSYTYPVAFDTLTYNPATLNVTAGPGDTYRVRVLAGPTDGNGLTGTALTSEAVNAVWDIGEIGTAGDNTADITLNWVHGTTDELTGFDDLSNAVSKNDGVNGWDALYTSLGARVVAAPLENRTRTGVTGFGAFAVGGKSVANQLNLGIQAWLQGPYDPATDLMKDGLRTPLLLIPTTSPYSNAAPFNYIHVGYGGGEMITNPAVLTVAGNNAIEDWILVEIRSAATPAIRLASRAALIQRDGDIVDLDGVSPVKVYGLTDGSYHVAIRHRNHVSARTNATVSLSNTNTALTFKTLANVYSDGAGNGPEKEVETGVYGLWAGDCDFNNKVRVTPLLFPPPGVPSDRVYILDIGLLGNPTSTGLTYGTSDVNMDGKTRVTPLLFPPPGIPSDAVFILDNVLLGNPTAQITADN